MLRFLPLFLLLFPVLELWVMIEVGARIGALTTIALLGLSVFVGLTLLRLRGARMAQNMRAEFAEGRIPANSILDSFCFMAAGWLFILPGFLSDAIALFLIIPGARHVLLALAVRALRTQGFQTQTTHFHAESDASGPVSWTCSTYNSGPTRNEDGAFSEHERRGNAVVIDCEPEASENTPSGSAIEGDDKTRR